jgi:hypothetical protein
MDCHGGRVWLAECLAIGSARTFTSVPSMIDAKERAEADIAVSIGEKNFLRGDMNLDEDADNHRRIQKERDSTHRKRDRGTNYATCP